MDTFSRLVLKQMISNIEALKHIHIAGFDSQINKFSEA